MNQVIKGYSKGNASGFKLHDTRKSQRLPVYTNVWPSDGKSGSSERILLGPVPLLLTGEFNAKGESGFWDPWR